MSAYKFEQSEAVTISGRRRRRNDVMGEDKLTGDE